MTMKRDQARVAPRADLNRNHKDDSREHSGKRPRGLARKPPTKRLRIWKWRPTRRHPIVAGFASVEFAIGLRLEDIPVFRNGTSGPWVGIPRAAREVLAWRNREVSDRFGEAVIALLLKKDPTALDPPSDPLPQRESKPASATQPLLLEYEV